MPETEEITEEKKPNNRRGQYIEEIADKAVEKLTPWLTKLESLITAEVPAPEVKRTEIPTETKTEIPTEMKTEVTTPEIPEVQSSVNTQIRQVRRGLGILF